MNSPTHPTVLSIAVSPNGLLAKDAIGIEASLENAAEIPSRLEDTCFENGIYAQQFKSPELSSKAHAPPQAPRA